MVGRYFFTTKGVEMNRKRKEEFRIEGLAYIPGSKARTLSLSYLGLTARDIPNWQ